MITAQDEMHIMNKISYIILSILLLTSTLANAQDKESESVKTGNYSVEMRGWPGGPLLAQIIQNAPVKIVDQKEEWTQVTITGWVKDRDLVRGAGNKSTRPKINSADLAKTQITLIKANVRDAKQDLIGNAGAIVVELFVKNDGASIIPSWTGVLVIEDQQNRVLVRNSITHNNANLNPGDEGSVSFYWEKGDESFEKLINTNKDSLIVSIHQIK